jgi:hypothetical protein
MATTGGTWTRPTQSEWAFRRQTTEGRQQVRSERAAASLPLPLPKTVVPFITNANPFACAV